MNTANIQISRYQEIISI